MTKEETVKILMVIQASYPNFKVENKNLAVNTWHTMLEDYDKDLIMASLKAFIATDSSGFAPSIGQIINKATELYQHTSGNSELSEAEAWSLVSKALRNGVYGSEQEFNKLPETVQKAVGSHEMLRVWATDESFNESVVSSNFMRSYRATVERKKEFDKLPASVKQMISTSTQTMIEG